MHSKELDRLNAIPTIVMKLYYRSSRDYDRRYWQFRVYCGGGKWLPYGKRLTSARDVLREKAALLTQGVIFVKGVKK